MKKTLVIIGLCLLAGYLIFAAFYFKDKPMDGLCTKLEVVVDNKGKEQFINPSEIEKYISSKGLDPRGKSLKDINTLDIEETIASNPLIKKAEVFSTADGAIKVQITERKPVLRVMTNDGDSYYVDEEGIRMPLSKRSTAYLPIASGAIKESFAREELYKFALFLQNDVFWNAQIEQIVVEPNNDITLIPRVGNQQIILGGINNYQDKLDKLMKFYLEGQNEIGWNKYSIINLKFDKQIVCTKR